MKNKFAFLLTAFMAVSVGVSSLEITSYAADSSSETASAVVSEQVAEEAGDISSSIQSTEQNNTENADNTSVTEEGGTASSAAVPAEKSVLTDSANNHSTTAEKGVSTESAAIESSEKTDTSNTAVTKTDAAAVKIGWTKGAGSTFKGQGGKILKNTWAQIDGKYYYFNNNGSVHTGGLNKYSNWYNFNSDGTLMNNKLIKWKGKVYFYGTSANGSGQKVNIFSYNTKSNKVSTTTFYSSYGARLKNTWAKINGKYYYFDSSATAKTGGMKMYSNWYNFRSDGTQITGQFVTWKGKTYYYAPASGTGGQKKTIKSYSTSSNKVSNVVFYTSYGARKYGWQKINGSWYYFQSDGSMAKNKKVGKYYVGKDGKRVSNTSSTSTKKNSAVVYWVDGGKVYHKTSSCPSLKRSKNIRHGTIAQSGKSKACKNCY